MQVSTGTRSMVNFSIHSIIFFWGCVDCRSERLRVLKQPREAVALCVYVMTSVTKQMYIIRVKQAGHEFQHTQGQFKIPRTSANAKMYCMQTSCFWTKTCKLICWYPDWKPGVISVQPLPCYSHYVHL